MGEDKALLSLGKDSFIERLCKELKIFDERIIATGNQREISVSGWRSIPDRYPDRGPIGGIHTILSQCKSQAIFFVSCDIPFLSGELSKEICEYLEDDVQAVITVTAEGRIQPLCGIYKKTVLPLLEQQIFDKNYKLTTFLDKLEVKYIRLDKRKSLQLQNINTKEEYKRLLKK